MKISTENMEWGTVVKVTGSLDLAARNLFEEYPFLQSCASRVALDLAGVDFIDSTGLGALVCIIRRLENAGKRVVLVNLVEGVLRILKMTSVDQIVGIADSMNLVAEMLRKEPTV